MTHPMPRPFDALLLDIEGTTSAIAFVYDVLFPYARAHLGAFLATHFDAPEVRADVARLGDGHAATAAEATALALALMDADVKDTGLKALQGRVWVAGYADGQLRGHVFDDVPAVLRATAESGCPVYLYSSGSIAAQRLLFAHTAHGDLTPWLSGYFDTTTGPKRVPGSYAAIAAAIALPPGRLRFVTDVVDEAHAAAAAGLQVALSRRPGNPAPPPHPFREVTDLHEAVAPETHRNAP